MESYTVDLANQEVIVEGPISYDAVLEKIKKTGKEASSDLIVMMSVPK